MLVDIMSELTYPDLDACKKEQNITDIEDDEEMLRQFLHEGATVYFFIDPYTQDLTNGEKSVMCWYLTRTHAVAMYDINCDEI